MVLSAESSTLDYDSPVPIYYQLGRLLRQQIAEEAYVSGERFPSERELAGRYGINRVTARKAIEALVDEELLFRRRGMGTFVARQRDRTGESESRTHNVCVGLYDLEYITHPYFSITIKGIGEVLDLKGYHLQVSTTHRNSRRDDETFYMRVVRDKRVDGLVIIDQVITDGELLRLREKAAGLVLVDRELPGSGISCVLLDNRHGMRQIVEHLIDRGHKRMLLVLNSLRFFNDREKLAGYREALEAHGIAYDDSLVTERSMDALDGPEPPGAVIFGDDVRTLDGIKSIRQRGLRIPKDLAVASFMQTAITSQIEPSLTGCRAPLHEMGAASARVLLDLIQGEEGECKRICLEMELVSGAST